jgi:beta-glucanase (GH16 family)
MKTMQRLTLLLTFVCLATTSFAQSWQLVWSDEFTSSISSDWVFETGNGSGGWGNNELQYYRRENASVQNGQLVITAKRESYGGFSYTSARMKTQGKKSWKYGKVEARIAMPAFQGVWPAFWMLGDNISSVSWPACGEIDIMEHVNTENKTYGTIHWQDNNGNYANYGGNTSASVTSFHVYAIEWDASAIKWYIDGVKFHEANILNSINGTDEFHKNFFILLNMAIGGNWPGFTIDNNAFPAYMYVDYVRVYQNTTCAATTIVPYIQVNGGSWVNTASVTVTSGSTVKLGPQPVSGGSWSWSGLASGTSREVTINPTSSGTATATYTNSCGTKSTQVFTITVSGSVSSVTIQAESYSSMSGVQTEATSDAGGGTNVGWIDAGDWMAYSNINFPYSGTYNVEYRVASLNGGGRLSLDLNSGSNVLGYLDVPSTGGWQNWTTISHSVVVNAGTYSVGVYAQAGGWNINWLRITYVNAAKSASINDTEINLQPKDETGFKISFNSLTNELKLMSEYDLSDGLVKIYDMAGRQVLSFQLLSDKIDVSTLRKGVYILSVTKNNRKITRQFIK